MVQEYCWWFRNPIPNHPGCKKNIKKTCKQWDGQLPISTGDRLAWFHPSVSHDQIHIIKPQQSIESKEVFDALLGGVAGGRGGRPPKQEDFLKKTQTKKQREASTKTSCWWTSFVFLFCFLHVYWYFDDFWCIYLFSVMCCFLLSLGDDFSHCCGCSTRRRIPIWRRIHVK